MQCANSNFDQNRLIHTDFDSSKSWLSSGYSFEFSAEFGLTWAELIKLSASMVSQFVTPLYSEQKNLINLKGVRPNEVTIKTKLGHFLKEEIFSLQGDIALDSEEIKAENQERKLIDNWSFKLCTQFTGFEGSKKILHQLESKMQIPIALEEFEKTFASEPEFIQALCSTLALRTQGMRISLESFSSKGNFFWGLAPVVDLRLICEATPNSLSVWLQGFDLKENLPAALERKYIKQALASLDSALGINIQEMLAIRLHSN